MAEPPQMAVPIPIRLVNFKGISHQPAQSKGGDECATIVTIYWVESLSYSESAFGLSFLS